MRALKKFIQTIIPAPIYARLLSGYHYSLAFTAAFTEGFPSRKIIVVGVTGTKGKSSVTEMISAICEEAGFSTALINSIHIKIGKEQVANTMRMSTPGRFFLHNFLARAVAKECKVAIIEMTSEGARQHRHRGMDLDMLLFLNLSPEHVESHGSFEEYADAKFELGKQLVRSRKRPRVMIANADDPASGRYMSLQVEHVIPVSLSSLHGWEASDTGGHFPFDGTDVAIRFPGEFSISNALMAATACRALGVKTPAIVSAFQKFTKILGRAESIEAGQDFLVIVDYAHTPDSMTALFKAFEKRRKICLIGSMGGGRDTWKRPVMGGIADEYCETVIVTNEDPCDEDPEKIAKAIASGMKREPLVIMDRRAAIRHACEIARPGDAVLITGKGTDPTMYGPNGTSIPWSDARIAHEEIERVLYDRGILK
jgi:UDP-N-acetylmuramoyl-L-alanyl-D-glutamate--2,6-diaminopimelate ligase